MLNKIRVHESSICSVDSAIKQVITTYLICRLFDMADSAKVPEAVARLALFLPLLVNYSRIIAKKVDFGGAGCLILEF